MLIYICHNYNFISYTGGTGVISRFKTSIKQCQYSFVLLLRLELIGIRLPPPGLVGYTLLDGIRLMRVIFFQGLQQFLIWVCLKTETACSKVCGGGVTRTMARNVSGNGLACLGENTRLDHCNENVCPWVIMIIVVIGMASFLSKYQTLLDLGNKTYDRVSKMYWGIE